LSEDIHKLFDKFLVSIACKYNCPEIVKLICESIHDIDDICLQYACENDNYELVQYLLNYCIVCYESIEVVCQHENLPILKLLKPSCKYHDNMLAIAYAHGHDIMNFLGFAYLNYEIIDYLFTNFRIDLAINDFELFRKFICGGDLVILMRVCQNLPKDWKSHMTNYDNLMICLFKENNIDIPLYLAKL